MFRSDLVLRVYRSIIPGIKTVNESCGPIVKVAIAFAFLNAPFWWLAHSNFLHRAWLNVDLLLPLMLLLWGVIPAVVALLIFWALDMAVSQALAWHFHSPWEFIRSIEFVPAIDISGYASLGRILMTIPFILCAAIAFWVLRGKPKINRAAIVIFLIVALADVFNGSSFVKFKDQRRLQGNVAGSALKMSISSLLRSGKETLQPLPIGGSRALTDTVDIAGWAQAHPDRSIIFVVVESMGIHNDPRMRKWLHDQLINDSINARFDVTQSEIPFHGSTVSAELRELCRLDGDYRILKPEQAKGCIPHQLAASGWQSVGLHGFSHRMFMRGEWWPITGLSKSLFAEDLNQMGQPVCGGAFVGICDRDLLRRAAVEASTSRKLVYVLTLNSHLPLPSITEPADLAAVCKLVDAGENVCGLMAVLGGTLRAVRDAALSNEQAPLVMIVGDHAPPFVELAPREQFSQASVPGFVLLPRSQP